MESKYNTRNPSVKRLMREAQELHEPTEDYFAQPLDDNLFEWHFTVRGPDDTAFEGGVYHGRILLPSQYPMKPPSIIMLTPNGRFETNKKICLSISGHHPESWRPSWSIRTALMAIIGFLPTPAGGAIASLEYGEAERRSLAASSQRWACRECGEARLLLAAPGGGTQHHRRQAEARQLAAELSFQGEKPKEPTSEVNSSSAAGTLGDGGLDSAAALTEPAVTSSREPRPAEEYAEPAVTSPREQRPAEETAEPGVTSPREQRPAEEPTEPVVTPPREQRPLEEPSWASSTLIVVLVAAIAALLCRRLFLLDAERLGGLPESL